MYPLHGDDGVVQKVPSGEEKVDDYYLDRGDSYSKHGTDESDDVPGYGNGSVHCYC